MKKFIIIFASILSIAALSMAFSLQADQPATVMPQDKFPPGFPADVVSILESSCVDCHISEASNVKAKGKLNFSKWEDMSDAKKVGKLETISEVVNKGDMPPARYLEKNPGAALSQAQKQTIVEWTDKESDKLLGESK